MFKFAAEIASFDGFLPVMEKRANTVRDSLATMAGVTSASMYLHIVKNAVPGNVAYTNLSEQLAKILRMGANDRSVIDRLQKGNWFEDPSDSSIACRQTGPISIGDIDLSKGGEEVFNQGISLIWKQQVVNRIYDKANDTLIYLSHTRQVQDGSAKMSLTSVPLYGQQVTWKNAKPQ